MIGLILRVLRRENPQLEAVKEQCVQEKKKTLDHVNGLKAELRELNGKRGQERA